MSDAPLVVSDAARATEVMFAAICDAWPEADVFTAVYDPKGTEGRFEARADSR